MTVQLEKKLNKNILFGRKKREKLIVSKKHLGLVSLF